MKKIISVLLALVIGCSCAATAFAADPVTITYKTNCEDTNVKAPADQAGEKMVETTVADAIQYDGHVFKYWCGKADGSVDGGTFEAGSKITPTGDITLYAIWEDCKHTVADAEAKWSEDYASCTKEWTCDKCKQTIKETVASDKKDTVNKTTYTATFKTPEFKEAVIDVETTKPASYTLTLVIKGGTADKKTTTTLKAGDTIAFSEVAPENCYLVGIFEDEACTKANTYKVMPEKDVTLYAQLALKLSKLQEVLKSIDVAAMVKASGVSQETFNKKAENLGYVIKFKVNDKDYQVKSFTDFADEIVSTCKADVAYGKTGTLVVTTQAGKNSQPETVTYFFYNDIKTEEPASSTTTTTTSTTESTTTEASSTEVSVSETNENTVPNTGSQVAIGAIVALCIAVAAGVAVVVTSKKKKSEEA